MLIKLASSNRRGRKRTRSGVIRHVTRACHRARGGTEAQTIRHFMTQLAARRYRCRPSDTQDWRRIQRVVVLLSSSRGGSSVLYDVLAQNAHISHLDGEIEPYYMMTGDCYPRNDSDAISELRDVSMLRDYIFDELTTETYEERWRKRLLLQFPHVQFRTRGLETLQDAEELLDAHGVAGFYDGARDRAPYQRCWKIEEAPFVKAKPYRELTEILLVKSCSDAYRAGVYERLFPWARVHYIHLTRNAAASINGLIDGWHSPYGFFSHRIADRWWNFDLPPGWDKWFDAPLEERCAFQWATAHEHILASYPETYRVRFERFAEDPASTVRDICRWLDVPQHEFQLRPTMTTAAPQRSRWKQRAVVIRRMMRRLDVRHTMKALDYRLDEDVWY